MNDPSEDTLLAIEIGGTKLQTALGAASGKIASKRRSEAPTQRTSQAVLQQIDRDIEALLAEAKVPANNIAGVGAGFGGPVDSAKGQVLTSHQVTGWDKFNLKDWFGERFNCPIGIFNDANAAGWAEYRVGAGKGTRHCCYMNVGSGIGGALIIDGRLHDGQGRGAFEIGHTIAPNPDGSPNKLENLCSGWAWERRLRDTLAHDRDAALRQLAEGGDISCERLAEAARRGVPAAIEEIAQTAEVLGIAIANAITLFHPERFVIGGGVSLMGDVLFEPLRRAVRDRVFLPYRDRYEIVPAALGEDVVLVGALLLAQADFI